jgi:hypothetical protein
MKLGTYQCMKVSTPVQNLFPESRLAVHRFSGSCPRGGNPITEKTRLGGCDRPVLGSTAKETAAEGVGGGGKALFALPVEI